MFLNLAKLVLYIKLIYSFVRFTLIGQNSVASTLTDRIRTVRISDEEQINVEEGDFLGIFFPRNDYGHVSYTRCSEAYEPDKGMQARSKKRADDDSKWNVGGKYQFVAASEGCKTWSLNAYI